MRETERIDALNRDADWLLVLPDTLTIADRGRIANIAQNMKKIAAFVVDRDAGPTLDARSALTAKTTECETYQRVGAETVTRLEAAMIAGSELLKQNNNLRETLGGKLEGLKVTAAEALLAEPQPNVAEAAGVVTDPTEIEGLEKP